MTSFSFKYYKCFHLLGSFKLRSPPSGVGSTIGWLRERTIAFSTGSASKFDSFKFPDTLVLLAE